jgi:hypothetical protein
LIGQRASGVSFFGRFVGFRLQRRLCPDGFFACGGFLKVPLAFFLLQSIALRAPGFSRDGTGLSLGVPRNDLRIIRLRSIRKLPQELFFRFRRGLTAFAKLGVFFVFRHDRFQIYGAVDIYAFASA